MKLLQTTRFLSPIGEIIIVLDAGRLCALDFVGGEARMMQLLQRRHGDVDLIEAREQRDISRYIDAYFAGDYRSLDAIPVELGGTPFQRQVWAALRAIPPRTTMTYGALAAQIGKPRAYRAVGMCNALNPVSIVVPCHRLIGANAALTGYGGGLDRKRWLLRHEGVVLKRKAERRTTKDEGRRTTDGGRRTEDGRRRTKDEGRPTTTHCGLLRSTPLPVPRSLRLLTPDS
jgi:methylated-DNA-[protein]-cysteine S-methyltransferase